MAVGCGKLMKHTREYPDLRQKVQRVLNQGHIDAEDFNGDPEFNVPGQKGIRPRQPRKKKNAEEEVSCALPGVDVNRWLTVI